MFWYLPLYGDYFDSILIISVILIHTSLLSSFFSRLIRFVFMYTYNNTVDENIIDEPKIHNIYWTYHFALHIDFALQTL